VDNLQLGNDVAEFTHFSEVHWALDVESFPCERWFSCVTEKYLAEAPAWLRHWRFFFPVRRSNASNSAFFLEFALGTRKLLGLRVIALEPVLLQGTSR
jgi:hypothetical protein